MRVIANNLTNLSKFNAKTYVCLVVHLQISLDSNLEKRSALSVHLNTLRNLSSILFLCSKQGQVSIAYDF